MKRPILKSYCGGIFFEFLVDEDKRDSIILLPGFPSSNIFDDKISYFYEKGFNVFVPRYLGSFQSEGKFLEKDPILDLNTFISFIKKGKTINLWDMKKISFQTGKIFLVGGSLGGSVALALSAQSKEVNGAILASPVFDFEKHNKKYREQDLDQMTAFVRRAFKNLYRYNFKSLTKKLLGYFSFIKKNYVKKLNIPILVFHDPSDKSISIEHSRKIKKELNNITLIETDTGHGLSSKLLEKYSSKIDEFLKRN